MSGFGALTQIGLLLAGANPPAPAYPLAAVLDAVRQACSDLSSTEAAEHQVAASGWTRAADPDATPIGALIRFGNEAGAKAVAGHGKMTGSPNVYSRGVDGETLYLTVSGAEVDGLSVVGCRAYDVDETRKVDAAAAQKWVGRAPDKTVDRAELTRLTWEPGIQPRQDSFEIYFVPAGSPVTAMTKFPGLAFKADAVRKAQ